MSDFNFFPCYRCVVCDERFGVCGCERDPDVWFGSFGYHFCGYARTRICCDWPEWSDCFIDLDPAWFGCPGSLTDPVGGPTKSFEIFHISR